MKKLFAFSIIIISYITSISVCAQNSKIENLKQQLKQHPEMDSLRADLLNDISFELGNVNLDSCLYYADKAFNLSKSINYDYGIAFSYHNLAVYYWRKGLMDSTIYYSKKGLEIFNKTSNIEGQIYSLNTLGIVYSDKSNLNEAIKCYFASLELCKTPGINHSTARINNNIGLIYFYLNNFTKSLQYYKESYNSFVLNKDSIGMGATLANIAENYERVDSFEIAKTYFHKSIVLSKKLNLNNLLPYSYSGLAITFDRVQQYDSAMYYHQKALELFTQFGDNLMIGSSLLYLGHHYFLRNDYNKSVEYIKNALPILEECSNLANISQSYHYLSKIYSKQKDFEKAFFYLDKHKQIEDSLKKEMSMQNLAVMEAEFAYKLQKEEIERQNQTLLSRQKNSQKIFIGSIAFILIIVLLISFELYQRVKRNKVLRKANDTRDIMMQLIAHDFRSPLISISSTVQTIPYLIDKMEYGIIKKMCENDEVSIMRVLTLIDNLINWTLSQHGNIPYNPDNYNLKDISDEILEIYKPIAGFKRIKLDNNIETELFIYADKNILRTILRNLINNAIKFTPENGEITLGAEGFKGKVKIWLQDNGIGIEQKKLDTIFNIKDGNTIGTKGEKGTGLGLFFCKEFATINQGAMWAESQIGKGSTFYFTVPGIDAK